MGLIDSVLAYMSHTAQPAISPVRILAVGLSNGQEFWTRMTLSDLGIPHQLIESESAVAALSRVKEEVETYDLVMINLKLPMLEIGEAIAALREFSPTAAARFAVLVVESFELKAVPPGCEPLYVPGEPEDIRRLLTRTVTPD